MLDFTKLIQSHLPTKVEVEDEDELGKKQKRKDYNLKIKTTAKLKTK